MAKIGIMGGTFDPIHNAHLMLGRQALKEYHLDEIWFMPSHNPPHKTDHRVTGTKDRCEMVKLAIAGEPRFRFSDFEISRAGNTYTAHTLKLLKEAYPKHTFFFIVGADSLYHIESWYHPEEVMRQVTILAAGRECEDASMEVSSQELREREMNGGRIHNLVPKNVERYIEEHGLYQNPEKL